MGDYADPALVAESEYLGNLFYGAWEDDRQGVSVVELAVIDQVGGDVGGVGQEDIGVAAETVQERLRVVVSLLVVAVVMVI